MSPDMLALAAAAVQLLTMLFLQSVFEGAQFESIGVVQLLVHSAYLFEGVLDYVGVFCYFLVELSQLVVAEL